MPSGKFLRLNIGEVKMFNKIRDYLNRDKNLINIFLVYFFLTFVIGYVDFDRRVTSFEHSTENLKKVITREISPPMLHRILVPYTIYFFHKISHLPLNYTYALFRFIFFFLSFVIFHIYLKKWFDDKLAMIGTLSVIASLPLMLTNWYCIPTDIPELITFILGAMWIRDNKYKNLFILIPIASLNRETALALVLLYFLNAIGKEEKFILVKRTLIYFLLWAVPSLILILTFGGVRDVHTFFWNYGYNIRGLLKIFKSPNPYNHYYFLLYLCGFYWILAFRNFSQKDPLLKRSVIVMSLLFLYTFFKAGGIHEVRIFIPFYTFVIPLGLFSLFEEDKQLLNVKGNER